MSEAGWALVTGAGRPIGRVLALASARAGYAIVVHDREAAAADGTVAEVRAVGQRAVPALADLTRPEDLAKLVAAVPGPLTLLVNCATLFEVDRTDTLDVDGWDAAFATNLRAPVLLAKAFAAALPAEREGLIVNVVDQRNWRLDPRLFSYGMSEGALWTATETLAHALAPRIRVNAVGPGSTPAAVGPIPSTFANQAAAVPLVCAVDVEEITAALTYLIGARSVTGQMIAVDGGRRLIPQMRDATE